MTNLNNKKNIIFDLGNVVLDIDLNITIERFKKLGFPKGENFIGKYRQNGIFHDYEVGKISTIEFIEGIKQQIPTKIKDEEIIEAWNALMGGYTEERIKTILKLKETHKVFLLSNTNALHVECVKDKVPIVGSLDNLFDKTYYSHQMHMSKPSNDIFNQVLIDADIKAEETIFLDDGLANVEAARKLGIESWLIEYPDQWVSKMNQLMSQ